MKALGKMRAKARRCAHPTRQKPPLFELKPVKAGMSRAKPAIEYRHGSRAHALKTQRKVMGWTRSEHDRIRWLAAHTA